MVVRDMLSYLRLTKIRADSETTPLLLTHDPPSHRSNNPCDIESRSYDTQEDKRRIDVKHMHQKK
ncbi:MAG: hypothetical protein M2R45_05238 [Verrucomicrobia subdivision 3 bacterium]|nr:hypothetical protein [Limisphaerales bacterium]MCS1417800.1 hypothetical protein [Limisphaerales bacterium]